MRDSVEVFIGNFLCDEASGLPEDYYTQSDVDKKSDAVFFLVYLSISNSAIAVLCGARELIAGHIR